MPIHDLFSKRGKQPPTQDMFRYDQLPQELCVQVVHIWRDVVGKESHDRYYRNGADNIWAEVHGILTREWGVYEIVRGDDGMKAAAMYISNDSNPIRRRLDVVETVFRVLQGTTNTWMLRDAGATMTIDEAIDEANTRFLLHAVGYQFLVDRIVRYDSTYVHEEVVKPVLTLLGRREFKTAEQEFLKAHEYYRHSDYSSTLNEALKAFESTMKIICDQRRWPFDKDKATASNLVDVLMANGLLPTSLQAQFTALGSVLKSGTPTVRNKNSGHGAGSQPIVIPKHLAAYAVHTAAANITLLVEAHLAK